MESLDEYIDQALEEEKKTYSSDLEPFEQFAAKFRSRIHSQASEYKDRFLNGYRLLEPASTNDEALERINGFEKIFTLLSQEKTLYEIFEYSPEIISQLYQKAYQMVEEKAYSDGADAYLFIATIAPNFREAWLNLGYCLSKLNNHLEAIEAFANALELDPANPDSYLAAAGSYLMLNDRESALAVCDYGIEAGIDELTKQLQEAKQYINRR